MAESMLLQRSDAHEHHMQAGTASHAPSNNISIHGGGGGARDVSSAAANDDSDDDVDEGASANVFRGWCATVCAVCAVRAVCAACAACFIQKN